MIRSIAMAVAIVLGIPVQSPVMPDAPAQLVIQVETPEGPVTLVGDGAEYLLLKAFPVATDLQGNPIPDPILRD